jgi:hypothetical protein
LSFSSVGSLKYSLLTSRILSMYFGGIPWFLTASECKVTVTSHESCFYATYHRKNPRSYMHRVSDMQELSLRFRLNSLHGKDRCGKVRKVVLGK